MIERMYSSDLDEKIESLKRQKDSLIQIISDIKNKIDQLNNYNNTFYSPASNYYVDSLNKELVKFNDFLKTLNDCINFLNQVKNNYESLDKIIIEKLGGIGSVNEWT